jgi:hypothetical protein
VLGTVIDRVADAGREPKKIVAPFLVHELGMTGRTETFCRCFCQRRSRI